MSKIAIIGSGFSGLASAAYLAKAGHEVHVFEKNALPGGRARSFHTDNGYTFDMGPSWYWMPEVFDKFFADFGYKVSDFYKLVQLNPGFDVVYGPGDVLSVPEKRQDLYDLFESIEPGSAERLKQFLTEAEYKYKVGMDKLVYKPGLSLTEFLDKDTILGALRLQVFSRFSDHVRKYFIHPKLIALMEFPVLFLGAMPQDTPALYSLMNHACLQLGTWYPMGGFYKIIEGMVEVGRRAGVQLHTSSAVQEMVVKNGVTTGIRVNDKVLAFDAVVASADYNHVETDLVPMNKRNYDSAYWEKKTFAPSCLIFYIGVNKRVKGLKHHTLFFDEDLLQHSKEIYKNPQWPSKPLFYVCCPSQTDDSVAPAGHENLFFLMPIATGLKDSEELREQYFEVMLNRLQMQTGEDIRPFIDYKKSYCVSDFMADYNSFKGNAYGLANTLMQTAILKPKMINKKIKNLFYTGQLTVPGPGVPPSLISGKVVSGLVNNYLTH